MPGSRSSRRSARSWPGGFEEGIAIADGAIEVARRHDARDALYLATSFKGMGQLFTGSWEEGLANIDEAAAAASSGQLDLRVASDIYCNTIAACRNVGDLARASQWADEGERWMRRNGAGGYPGICRVHRAELKMLHGQWSEAEQEARQACDELERFRLLDRDRLRAIPDRRGPAPDGRPRRGRRGLRPRVRVRPRCQPGLALLQLARGEVADARRSIERALAATSG